MERFKAYKLTETPDRKIKAEFVDMTLDDLDPVMSWCAWRIRT